MTYTTQPDGSVAHTPTMRLRWHVSSRLQPATRDGSMQFGGPVEAVHTKVLQQFFAEVGHPTRGEWIDIPEVFIQ